EGFSSQNDSYLDIYGITRDQAGEYECSAENDVSVPDVKKVKVTVNFAPTIQELKSSGVVLGGNGLIRCEGAGVPAPVFEWYRGERKLISGQQGITIKNYSTRSLLTVTNVTEEHFGNYTCVAANKLGMTNASLPLNRKTPWEVSKGCPELQPSTACPWLHAGRWGELRGRAMESFDEDSSHWDRQSRALRYS
uniref:Neuronal growth regulator 1 n=1 Tax=Pavo cristatus TaxID=9049 RepID=A0A8C9EQ50_PAVCR